MGSGINIQYGVTFAETLVSIIVIMILLHSFNLMMITSQNYIAKLKDISYLEWWIGTHQIERDIHYEMFLYCKSGPHAGIYFYDQKKRTMVYRFYKQQLIRSRYKNHRFYGYVPYIFSLNDFRYSVKNNQLVLEGDMGDEKKFHCVLDVQTKSQRDDD